MIFYPSYYFFLASSYCYWYSHYNLFVQFHHQVIHATQVRVLPMHTVKYWEGEQYVHVWKVLKVTLQLAVILNVCSTQTVHWTRLV